MIELRGKRAMVVGLGVTGRSVARFLASRGARLILTDRRADLDVGDLAPGEIRLGGENEAWLDGVEVVVTSPGVPPTSVLLQAAARRGIPVLSELELASRHLSVPIAAITGTNGKSTVTVMLGEMLKAAGGRVFVGGNLGTPLIDALGGVYDLAVVEVSSFQLEWIRSFRPHVAVHLNLSDDHFDRYRDLEEYGRAKARIFENQQQGDWAILNRDDPNVWKLRRDVSSRVLSFGFAECDRGSAIWPTGSRLAFDDGARLMYVDAGTFKLPGRHNLADAMAAAAAALLLDVEPAAVEQVLARFSGLPHRMEFVRELGGVVFIDDSKGTNVGAVVEALAGVKPPVILIAGGLDKGGDYAPLTATLEGRVRRAILIGAARHKMKAAFGSVAEVELVPTLAEAVRRAAQVAVSGDTVLLSPACASFDQFRDYAERGRVFKELVWSL